MSQPSDNSVNSPHTPPVRKPDADTNFETDRGVMADDFSAPPNDAAINDNDEDLINAPVGIATGGGATGANSSGATGATVGTATTVEGGSITTRTDNHDDEGGRAPSAHDNS
jgi:hypothetical protein